MRDTFLDPAARAFFADWPVIAAQAVAGLRQRRAGDRLGGRLASLD